MHHVLVTHADEPIGRRLVKLLVHDARVGSILAVGAGEPPRAFDALLAGPRPRVTYQRADLVRYRTASLLFRSPLVRERPIDAVVHLPRHGVARDAYVARGVTETTAEARLVLHGCLQEEGVRQLVAVGSAFVYRLAPGNANRLVESSELDFSPDADDAVRSWLNCDLLFQSALDRGPLRIAILRVPSVLGPGGAVYLNPWLAPGRRPRLRPLGFDPLCPLVSDKDVARAVQCALHARAAGVYNVSGHELMPLSRLARLTGRPDLALPGPLLRALAAVGRGGVRAPALRYGFTLDTVRAQRELGYQPAYRIAPARDAAGTRRLEAFPA